MLGNDVVDLREAERRPESFYARFVERVFGDYENLDYEFPTFRHDLCSATVAAFSRGNAITGTSPIISRELIAVTHSG